MQVYSGHSAATDAFLAVEEATSRWPASCEPDLILAFHSTQQKADEVALALKRHFPKAQIAGCTSAGEHLNGEHYNGQLVLTAIISPEIAWHVELIEHIDSLNAARAQLIGTKMMNSVGISRDQIDPERHFALCFIDGLSLLEEKVTALMAEALPDVPCFGGSAADDFQFKQTQVFSNQGSASHAAVFILGNSRLPFRLIKHQHFSKTSQRLVITRSDCARRRVYEIDGKPAAQAYAEALGTTVAELTPDVWFANPLILRAQNENYVRSIQKINEDQSIVFYCEMEEGNVMELGSRQSMEITLARDCERARSHFTSTELFIGCNSFLRAIESRRESNIPILGGLLRGLAPHIIAFDAYGEQLNGQHISQSLVGIILGQKAS